MNPIRVLIVEDHEMVAQAFSDALGREKDLELVGIVSTVRDARDSSRIHNPDVVLMDFRLPDGDGIEATSEIRSINPEIKVVMVTGDAQPSILALAIEAGCSGFLPKNRPLRELVGAIRAAHRGEVVMSPDLLGKLLPLIRQKKRPDGPSLSKREIEILALLARGMSNRGIADHLVLSPHTVRNHIKNSLQKLQAHSKLEAVSKAVQQGVISFPS